MTRFDTVGFEAPMVDDMLEGQAEAMTEFMKQQSIGRLGRGRKGKTNSETFTASTAMASHGRRMNAKIFFCHAPRDGETAGRYENAGSFTSNSGCSLCNRCHGELGGTRQRHGQGSARSA